MPFTPFHFGPLILLGFLVLSYIDVPSLLVSGVIVDLEGLFVLMFYPEGTVHGFFHSFIGAGIVAILVSTLIFSFGRYIKKIMAILKLKQDSPFTKILVSSFVGAYLHVVLDAFLYRMKPFYPLNINPFYGIFSISQVYIFCALCFIPAFVLYIKRVIEM